MKPFIRDHAIAKPARRQSQAIAVTLLRSNNSTVNFLERFGEPKRLYGWNNLDGFLTMPLGAGVRFQLFTDMAGRLHLASTKLSAETNRHL